MPTISKVTIKGIRGTENRTVELGQKTIITGPNGSGKSTIPVAIEFALLGLVPGYKKGEAIDNALGDFMGSTVQLGDTVIERTLLRGKTLQERISVNGSTPADAKAATPILEAILGTSPLIMNMPAFFACTSSEQRRMGLRLVADAETQKALAEAEAKARSNKNALADVRRGAEKAVHSLTASLTAIERPAGNLEELKIERTEIEKDLEAVRNRISKGEANDKARAELTGMMNAAPDIGAEIKRLETALVELNAVEEKLVAERAKLGDAPKIKSTFGLNKVAQAVVASAIDLLSAFKVGKTAANVVIETLSPLLPNDEELAKAQKSLDTYNKKLAKLSTQTTQNQRECRNNANAIASACWKLNAAEEAKAKIDGIGEPLDPNDKALQEGLVARLAETKAKIAPLEEIAVLVREIEKANLAAQDAIAAEEAAKVALDESIQAQSKIVDAASDLLATRSKDILPSGNLRMEDDGKDIIISWAKSDTLHVRRTTLSGGEQSLFDRALGHSLAPGALIVLEAAEIDSDNLPKTMEHITQCADQAQVIVLTCHAPAEIPEGWTHIALTNEPK